jgi:hypothetical protein
MKNFTFYLLTLSFFFASSVQAQVFKTPLDREVAELMLGLQSLNELEELKNADIKDGNKVSYGVRVRGSIDNYKESATLARGGRRLGANGPLGFCWQLQSFTDVLFIPDWTFKIQQKSVKSAAYRLEITRDLPGSYLPNRFRKDVKVIIDQGRFLGPSYERSLKLAKQCEEDAMNGNGGIKKDANGNVIYSEWFQKKLKHWEAANASFVKESAKSSGH